MLGAEDPILAYILALLWELWAFGKIVESVVNVVNLRGLALAGLSLLTGPDRGCVSVFFFFAFFYDFWFFGSFHFESFWA